MMRLQWTCQKCGKEIDRDKPYACLWADDDRGRPMMVGLLHMECAASDPTKYEDITDEVKSDL
jgi:hypothetical protein